MMRLLSKREAKTEQATQERQLAQEGLKLAKRVDRLRELAADEEASLEQFRSQTLAGIHSQIEAATASLEAITANIAERQHELERLNKPLDHREQELAKAEQEYQVKHTRLLQDQLTTERLAKETNERLHALEEKEKAIVKATEEANQLRSHASHIHEEATATLQEARQIHEKAMAHRHQLDTDTEQLQKDKEATAQRHQTRDAAQDKREQALNERETQLRDREETLARNLKRHAERTTR